MWWNERQESEQTGCSWERECWSRGLAFSALTGLSQQQVWPHWPKRATCEKSAADLRKYRFILLSSTELIIISSCKHNINQQKFNRGTQSSGMLMLKQKNTTRWCPKHITQYTSFPNLHSYFLISDYICLKSSIHFHMQTLLCDQKQSNSVVLALNYYWMSHNRRHRYWK